MTPRNAAETRYRPAFVLALLAIATLLSIGCSRNQPQAATIPTLPAIEFVGEWGVRGDAPGQLQNPVGPAIDAIGRVYLADRGTGFVQKFEISGIPLLTFEHRAARTADAIAVDSGGAIYLANARTGAIQVFFPEGEPLRVLRVIPERNWSGPFAFSIDTGGKILVPDPAGARIQVLTPEGRVQKIWRLASSSSGSVHPSAVVAAPDGFVYVQDASSGRILKFTNQGDRVVSWSGPGDDLPVISFAVAANHLFVLHQSSPRLEVWDLNGRQELVDDLGGRLGTSESGSVAIAAGPQGDLLVLDRAGPRVLHFRVHLDSPV
jgi:hypothetical protein